jgi:hypothetical protein
MGTSKLVGPIKREKEQLMTRIKTLGLALVAVFAFAAIAVSSASAQPEYFVCAKAAVKGTGHHAEKNCSDAFKGTGGGYNLVPGIGKGKVTKTKGGAATLHSVNPEAKVDIPVSCASLKGGGKDVAPNLVVGVTTTFSKCKALGAPCQNGKKETITTEVLAGQLGWLNKAGKAVGTDLVQEKTPGAQIAAFTCEALGEIRTAGSVIGQNTGNVGAISKTSTLTFAPGTYLGPLEAEEGKLKWTPIVNVPKFEGGPLDILKTEVKGAITGHPTEFYPPGGVPSGLEGSAENKGEALGIYETGTE